MQLKDLCRVSENFGYLNKQIPANFFRDFLCQFYQIFKKKIREQGYKKFVSGEFKQIVEKYLKTDKEIPGDIHEQFMSQS